MRSSFLEFRVATSGLQVARLGYNVTSHNVSNAENKGFSRQYIEQRAAHPLTFYNGRGMYGTGADVYGVGQHRSFFLDKKFWSENSIRGEYSIKNAQLSLIETVLNGISGTSLSNSFDDFLKSLQDLSQNSGDPTYRTNVISRAQTLVNQANRTYSSLKKQQSDINSDVGAMVQTINSLGSQIASLNRQIAIYEQDGSRANDLRDERVRLVDKLSGYVNVSVREEEQNADYAAGMYPEPEDRYRSNPKFTILINDEEFVTGDQFTGLEVRAREGKMNELDAEGLYDIYFSYSGKKLDLYSPSMSGELKALIDVRDGNNGYYTKGTANVGGGYDPVNKTLPITIAITNGKLDISPHGYIELIGSDGRVIQCEYKLDSINYTTGQAAITLVNPPDPTKTPNPLANITNFSIGRTTDYKGIPHYVNKLNEMVRTFSKEFNRIHSEGLDANGDQAGLFFDYDENDDAAIAANEYYKLNVLNLIVNPELDENPRKFGSATGEAPEDDSGESDNRNVLKLIDIFTDRTLFREGKLADFIIGISSELGIDVKQAKKFDKNYAEICTTVDNQRESIAGVNIDEEMTNMMRYQQLFQAASKLVNIIDEMYDTCINRLGYAGR